MGFRVMFPIAAAALFLAGCASGIAQESRYGPGKYHHTETGFQNPPGSLKRQIEPARFFRFVSRRLTEEFDTSTIPPNHVVPYEEAKAQLAATPNPRMTWINHATFLIALDGVNVLTDPFFSERASPVAFAGPKRYVPPGLKIEDLPPIDVILISHNHYDAYDIPSLRTLAARKTDTLVLVPLGLGELTRRAGLTNVKEVDWYDQITVGGVKLTSTPAIHWSRRTLGDTNESLWNGFMIEGAGKKIWFVGDTGFGPVFAREVAPRVGPADIALVPIGAFLPRDFMRPMHTNPAEALRLAKIIGAATAVPMHWGTLPLGEDTPKDGLAAFAAASEEGVTKRVMRIGETVDLDGL